MKNKKDNNEFCVISHNCWGAEVYRELNLPYNTPFVGLFVPSDCFVKMLSSIDFWLSQPLTFSKYSKYDFYNNFRITKNEHYPIGLLGGEIEIHFMHYANEQEAESKWKRRMARMPMDRDKWFLELSYREIFNEEVIRKFDDLPFRNKVFFSNKKIEDIDCLVYLDEFKNSKEVFDGKALYRISKYYFNVINWINSGGMKKKSIYQHLTLLLRKIKHL